jgi:hypothetical protein
MIITLEIISIGLLLIYYISDGSNLHCSTIILIHDLINSILVTISKGHYEEYNFAI